MTDTAYIVDAGTRIEQVPRFPRHHVIGVADELVPTLFARGFDADMHLHLDRVTME